MTPLSNLHDTPRYRPLIIRIGMEEVEVRSLKGAVELLQSLRFDRSGAPADRLCAQLKAARSNAEVDAAWLAFRRWTTACGLCPGDPDGGDHPIRHAA